MNEISKLLGLNKLECRVFDAVTSEPKIVATIARDTKLPRTSVDAIVDRLTNRGLLQKKKRVKRFYYQKNSDRLIMQGLFPQKTLPEGEYVMPLLNNAGIIVHSGTNKLLKLYESLFTKYSDSRIYGIQPTASVLYILNKLSQKKINYINSLVTKNKVVNEVILEEDYFDEIKKMNPINFKSWLRVFIDRAAITHVVKKGTISFQSELILHNETAILVDWQNSIAIEIFHPEIVKMLGNLFENFQSLGTRVEYRTLVQKYQS